MIDIKKTGAQRRFFYGVIYAVSSFFLAAQGDKYFFESLKKSVQLGINFIDYRSEIFLIVNKV